MTYALFAVAGVVVGALLTAIVTGWMIWRDRSEEEVDTDYLNDFDPGNGL